MELILNVLTIRPVGVLRFVANKYLNLFGQEDIGIFRKLLFKAIFFGHSNEDVIEGFFLKGNAEILKRLLFLLQVGKSLLQFLTQVIYHVVDDIFHVTDSIPRSITFLSFLENSIDYNIMLFDVSNIC